MKRLDEAAVREARLVELLEKTAAREAQMASDLEEMRKELHRLRDAK